ncbi:UNKNOWN [Stylonychia lemnae]|uniref:Uncharacterized protein n=1 Tax=Stylonychia lemnae TaxID=5949 RepID=A0A077ZVJ2_STYLE|nr:UNKNOWN [Stylonychia lemnae]|eukprot:CDW73879.1 UNKNOWN [Stylonychia lemnae]
MSYKDSIQLFRNVSLTFPTFNLLHLRLSLPYFGEFILQHQLLKTFVYFGMASASFCLIKLMASGVQSVGLYLKTFFNAKKYTSSQMEFSIGSMNQSKYYAVIYGTSNRAGRSFAKYLAGKGFNLILIDRDIEVLMNFEKELKSEFEERKIQICSIELNKFDVDQLRAKLLPLKDLPVKLFVNCKNTKKNAVKHQERDNDPLAINSGNVNQSLMEVQTGEELISKEEVYFSTRENIDGYSALASVFLYQMRRDSVNPAVINVDSDEKINLSKLKRGQLLFLSTLQYQDTFTTLLSRQYKDVATINVKVNFQSLKDNLTKQKQMCDQTFQYLGVLDTISVQ